MQAEIQRICLETLANDKVTVFVTVQRKSLFGDNQEMIIPLYARACVNESTNEVSLGCELKTEPIF